MEYETRDLDRFNPIAVAVIALGALGIGVFLGSGFERFIAPRLLPDTHPQSPDRPVPESVAPPKVTYQPSAKPPRLAQKKSRYDSTNKFIVAPISVFSCEYRPFVPMQSTYYVNYRVGTRCRILFPKKDSHFWRTSDR